MVLVIACMGIIPQFAEKVNGEDSVLVFTFHRHSPNL